MGSLLLHITLVCTPLWVFKSVTLVVLHFSECSHCPSICQVFCLTPCRCQVTFSLLSTYTYVGTTTLPLLFRKPTLEMVGGGGGDMTHLANSTC